MTDIFCLDSEGSNIFNELIDNLVGLSLHKVKRLKVLFLLRNC